MHAALVGTALIVTERRPSLAATFVVVVVGNVVWTWCFVTMLGMLRRPR